MHIKKEILIDAKSEKIFQIFSDLERWHQWGGCIIKAMWISGREWQPESMFLQTVRGFGMIKKFDSKVKILESEPCKKVTWTGTRKLINGTHTFEFKGIGNKTKVSNFENFRGILAPVLFPLFKNNFEIYFEQFLEGLKKEAEK